MKVTAIIRQSRIMKIAMVGLLIILLASFAVTWLIYGDHPVDKKAIEEFAEIIVPFGQYEKIFVVDGEKEIFLVEEDYGDSLKLVNVEGSIIADLAPMDQFVRQNGKLLVLMHDFEDSSQPFEQQYYDLYAVVNYEELAKGAEYEPQYYSSYEVQAGGMYYAGRTKDQSAWEICSAEGKVLCRRDGDRRVSFFAGDNLVQFRHFDADGEHFEIVDLAAGKQVDTGGHDVVDFNGSLWICDSNNPLRQDERYVLNADFEPPEEEIVGENLRFSGNGRYIYGQLCVPAEDGKTVKAQNFAADAHGNIIYKGGLNTYFNYGGEGDVELAEINGDTLIQVNHLEDGRIAFDCIMLDQGGEPVISGQEGYCLGDFDDGVALCNVSQDPGKGATAYTSQIYTRLYLLDDALWLDWHDWYYMDKDGEIYDFIFEFGLPTADGYAAVKTEKKWGVIRFRD